MSARECITIDDERMKELKAFDDTKLGVKGLVDDGIVNIPKIFIRPTCHEEKSHDQGQKAYDLRVPVIDLQNPHETIVQEIITASENWGIFQVVNHGIPIGVTENMINGAREFNEGDIEVKKKFYSRETHKSVKFNSNFDLFRAKTVAWRDTLSVHMEESNQIDPNDLPSSCRIATIEFINQITELGSKLLDLLSEGLGLKPDYLRSMDCNGGKFLVCNYYPECPEPDLAIGVTEHSDSSFLTILAQDQTGGLQVFYQNKYWVDVEPIPGALVVNMGDFLQLVSNDKFKSIVHRVRSSRKSRVSVALFFHGDIERLYGPITELTSHENTPKYSQFKPCDHLSKFEFVAFHEKPGVINLGF